MPVTVSTDVTLFVPAKNLQRLMYDKAMIAQLARQLVAGQAEAHIDMAYDCASEYKTHAEAVAVIGDAKTTVEDYIEDLLTEFRGELIEQVRKVVVNVKTTSFSAEGFEDAEVVVE